MNMDLKGFKCEKGRPKVENLARAHAYFSRIAQEAKGSTSDSSVQTQLHWSQQEELLALMKDYLIGSLKLIGKVDEILSCLDEGKKLKASQLSEIRSQLRFLRN